VAADVLGKLPRTDESLAKLSALEAELGNKKLAVALQRANFLDGAVANGW
jgi:hypothetical protein